MKTWRLLQDGDVSGTWNMAVDAALLASASGSQGQPTLRLYGWEGPWLSLGYAQTLSPSRGAACREAGVGIARRPTGGSAVLHGCDLTYALAAPKTLLPDGLRATYDLVAGALLEALAKLGVDAQRWALPAAPGSPRSFDCFAEPASDEICVAGRKLCGSAQRRLAGAVLQHGSIRLRPDPAWARQAAGLHGAGTTSLAEQGAHASQRELREACQQALAAALGCRFEPGRLDQREREHAHRASPRAESVSR